MKSPAFNFAARRGLTTRINMWCGPRTCSTSLMYAFHQRGDTACFDEPLYAHHLRVCPELERPYKQALMESQDPNGDAVARDIIMGDHGKPLVFLKHMAKQFIQMDRSFLTHQECANVMLIRKPLGLVNSFAKALGGCTVEDTCLPHQVAMMKELTQADRPVHVVVSEHLLDNPEPMLRALCTAVGVDFTPKMLTWPPGPKTIDGVWAAHWFDVAVQKPRSSPLSDPSLAAVLEECTELYESLAVHALKPLDT